MAPYTKLFYAACTASIYKSSASVKKFILVLLRKDIHIRERKRLDILDTYQLLRLVTSYVLIRCNHVQEDFGRHNVNICELWEKSENGTLAVG